MLMATHTMRETRQYIESASEEELERAIVEYSESKTSNSSRVKRSPKACPVLHEAHLSEHDTMNGMRSMSPYDSRLDFNPRRYEKYYRAVTLVCL